jgi:hypothetical protein
LLRGAGLLLVFGLLAPLQSPVAGLRGIMRDKFLVQSPSLNYNGYIAKVYEKLNHIEDKDRI